ncbi:MAG: hypothetical protein AB9891_05230 [Anaerolineaceae bacterium]
MTATIQPDTLAYLQSFPHFDPSQMVTSTKAPAQACPQPDGIPAATPVFHTLLSHSFAPGVPVSSSEDILNFLNNYGVDPLIGKNKSPRSESFSNGYVEEYQDFTNDSVPELLINAFPMVIYGCRDGKYQELLSELPGGALMMGAVERVADLNKNGVPEIYLVIEVGSMGGTSYKAYEWDGNELKSILHYSGQPAYDQDVMTVTLNQIQFIDVDNDGINEIIADNKVPYQVDLL